MGGWHHEHVAHRTERPDGPPPTGGAPERRTRPRIPASLIVHCRRLGRTGIDQDVQVVDVSMGGMRIAAPERLELGDLVALTMPKDPIPLRLKGLVVGTTPKDAGVAFGHIAFTGLGVSTSRASAS